MTPKEQIDEWVKGNSIHNDEDRSISVVDKNNNIVNIITLEGGECCPDFSCCRPEMRWPIELREKFKQSNEEVRQQMLMMSLNDITKEYKDMVYTSTQNSTIH